MGGKLYEVRVVWPPEVQAAFADGRWSVSPAELWIEMVMLRLVMEEIVWPDDTFVLYVTDFTDNESARATANKGNSATVSMAVMGRRIANMTARPQIVLRTMRVTTKENMTSDGTSREGGEDAGRELAKRLGVQHILHEIARDDPVWNYISVGNERPPSPNALPPRA